VPALVEADDFGMYVVKLRGAAQGGKALVAELVAGEIARALELAVPELVLIELAASLASAEPDPELAEPLEASAGTNLGLDYLPGSITFDPVAGAAPDALTASRVVLFDAFVLNVDRSASNPNLLEWHNRLWLIDHGAALYVHHGWAQTANLEATLREDARDPFAQISTHVLLPWATHLGEAASHLRDTLRRNRLDDICAAIPSAWLDTLDRAAYADFLSARLEALPLIVAEAERARSV
jgi:hypothetical protein